MFEIWPQIHQSQPKGSEMYRYMADHPRIYHHIYYPIINWQHFGYYDTQYDIQLFPIAFFMARPGLERATPIWHCDQACCTRVHANKPAFNAQHAHAFRIIPGGWCFGFVGLPAPYDDDVTIIQAFPCPECVTPNTQGFVGTVEFMRTSTQHNFNNETNIAFMELTGTMTEIFNNVSSELLKRK